MPNLDESKPGLVSMASNPIHAEVGSFAILSLTASWNV